MKLIVRKKKLFHRGKYDSIFVKSWEKVFLITKNFCKKYYFSQKRKNSSKYLYAKSAYRGKELCLVKKNKIEQKK